MNNCLTAIANIQLLKDGVAVTLPTPATVEEARTMTLGLAMQMGPMVQPIITNATATGRTLTYVGEFNGCCVELSWDETFGVCTPSVCVFDLCDFLGQN